MELVHDCISKIILPNFKQGSVEWYNARKSKLGGSEAGTIKGENTFCTIDDLILNKTGLVPPTTYHVGDIIVATKSFSSVNEGDFLIVETEQSYNKIRVVKIGKRKQPLSTYFYISGDYVRNLTDDEIEELQSNGIEYPGQIANNVLILAGSNINENSSDKLPLNWGILFEDINQWYVEQDLETKIEYTDCYLHNPDIHPRITYSPDGIGILEDKVTLFEFKCPFSRDSNKDAPSPAYVTQVQLGMEVIPVIEQGLLCRATFRLCDITFEKDYGHLSQPKPLTSSYLAYGVICFYGDEFYAGQPIDIGALHKLSFSKIISKLTRLESTKYFNFMVDEDFDPTIINGCYGYICWKLFDMTYDHIDKHETGLVQELRPKLEEVFEIIDSINAEENYYKKLIIFEEYKNNQHDLSKLTKTEFAWLTSQV